MPALLQASADAAARSAELPTGYGAALLQSLLALLAVCILAWVVLRWVSQRGVGLGTGKRVRVLERVPLDARRQLYLVEVGGKVLLIGAGDGSAPRLIAEVDPGALPEPEAPPGMSFAQVLARLRGGGEPTDEPASDD